MQNTRNPGKKHSYMSNSVPVKRVTAVLRAREDVQRASSVDSEELSRRCEGRSVAHTGQKYEPGVGIRYDVILGSLLKRRSGEHDERDLACEIKTLGAKRLSSSVERSIPRQQWSGREHEQGSLWTCEMFSSHEQDISREQQSRDLTSETIESGAESMTQLNDKYFK